jgi:hypothetical protein
VILLDPWPVACLPIYFYTSVNQLAGRPRRKEIERFLLDPKKDAGKG